MYVILYKYRNFLKRFFTNKIHARYIFVTLLRSVVVLRITVIFSPPNVTWKKILHRSDRKRVKDGSQNRGIRGETNGIQQQQQEVVSAWRTVSFLLQWAFSFFFLFIFFTFFASYPLSFSMNIFSFLQKWGSRSYNKPFVSFRTSASINFDIEGRNYLPRTKKYHVQPL